MCLNAHRVKRWRVYIWGLVRDPATNGDPGLSRPHEGRETIIGERWRPCDVDKLQWEKNELEAENVRLRDEDPEQGRLCDRLKQSEAKISELESDLHTSEERLAELQETADLEGVRRR